MGGTQRTQTHDQCISVVMHLFWLIRTTQSNHPRCPVSEGPLRPPQKGGAHQPQSVRVMEMDLRVYAHHERAHTHTHIKMCEHKQQGEVKAINVSELAMHHTSALIDRWHQESVTHTQKITLSEV